MKDKEKIETSEVTVEAATENTAEVTRDEVEREKQLDREEELKKKRFKKKLIRRFAIIFIIVLLLLTFFSNTIMNYSLPEISTVTVSRGSVSEKVRCQGNVEVSKDIEVTVSGERIVKEVLVEDGDEVKEGDVIMTFEASENDAIATAEGELETLEVEYEKTKLSRSETEDTTAKTLATAKSEMDAAQAALDKAKSDESAIAAAKAEQDAAQEAYDAKNIEVQGLQTQVDAYTAIPDYSGDVNIDELVAKLATAKEELTALENTLNEKKAAVESYASSKSVADTQAELDTKTTAYNDAVEADARQKRNDSKTAQSNALSDQQTEKQIEEKKKKIEKMKNASDLKEVKATGTGIISGLTAKEGDKVNNESTLANIQLADSGYEMTCSIDKKDAMKLKVGNEAQPENVWEDDVIGVVRSIKADTTDPNQKSIVKFNIKGSVQAGQTIQLAVGDKSGKYDTVVPNNAVKEDSNGNFVYVVNVKATPLGNRYIVEKVKVEVIASDTNNAAIRGEVSEYSNVVVNASKPLDNGQQVRLADK